MSARRLAAEQPESFAFSGASGKEVDFWLNKFPDSRKQSAVIPLLWLAQQQEGWVTRAAMESIADQLDMPKIRVLEVATFYTMFNLAPVGAHHIQLCGTTPCMLRGANDLKDVLQDRIGKKGSTSSDGKFTWSEVECLGSCCNAPMVQISNSAGHHYFEDLTPETLGALMDKLAAGETVKPGPQNGRQTSAPEGGPETLKDKSLFDGSRGTKLKSIPNAPEQESKAEAEAKADTAGEPVDKGKPKETTRESQEKARTDTQQTPDPETKQDHEPVKKEEASGKKGPANGKGKKGGGDA